ncbi:3579_t:CDS:2, partial [Paraglomus occultum]
SIAKKPLSFAEDRASLLGSNRSDTGPSSLASMYRESDASRVYEQQNDLRLKELNNKLSALHKITVDINNEVNADIEVLDDSSGTFSSFDGSLSGTMDRLKQMTSIRHQRYM